MIITSNPATKNIAQPVIVWEGKPYTAGELVPLLGLKRREIRKKFRDGTLEAYVFKRLKLGIPKKNEIAATPVITWEGKAYTAGELTSVLDLGRRDIRKKYRKGILETYMYKRLVLGLPKNTRRAITPHFFTWRNKSYRVDELASLLGLSISYVHTLRREGKLGRYMTTHLKEKPKTLFASIRSIFGNILPRKKGQATVISSSPL